jgi:hypothetical protein
MTFARFVFCPQVLLNWHDVNAEVETNEFDRP